MAGLDAEAKTAVDPQQEISERVGDFIPREPVRRDLALQIENRKICFTLEIVALFAVVAASESAKRQTETQCASADFGIA
jgi:hypothetical protein